MTNAKLKSMVGAMQGSEVVVQVICRSRLTRNAVRHQAAGTYGWGQLSVLEFGRNILSDDEFPTRESLVSFAREHGVLASRRDTKQSLRRKLMSKAELRNMDDLMRSDER
jgi:hypothetical protein